MAATSDETKMMIETIRTSLRPDFPEIDSYYSDEYLASVLSVPNRTFEYARDEKIRGALQWRREYDVDVLCDAFCHVQADNEDGTDGIFCPKMNAVISDKKEEDCQGNSNTKKGLFAPSQSLIDICQSRAFVFGGYDHDGRAILLARTAHLDWWKTGVEDGVRYHVLVIEHVLRMIRERNNNTEKGGREDTRRNEEDNLTENKKGLLGEATPESIVLYVDTSNLSFIPPPLGALTGMTKLLQRAYPDRVHKIYIGPVNAVLMNLHKYVSPYLRPRSRDKICLLDVIPDRDNIVVRGG